jgi:hypothetical protein
MLDPPTRDFMRWDREIFHEQKSPEYYKRQEQRLIKLRATKKQKPVTTIEPPWHDHRDIPVAQPSSQSDAEVARPSGHTADPPCHDHQDISRVNHSVVTPDPLLSGLDLLGIAAQRQRLDALSARLAVFGGLGKKFRHEIPSVGDDVSTLGTSTLGTLDAGLIVTNPSVA